MGWGEGQAEKGRACLGGEGLSSLVRKGTEDFFRIERVVVSTTISLIIVPLDFERLGGGLNFLNFEFDLV